MKKYKLNRAGSEIKETGYAQEGYEKILPYKLWLTLCKVTLTKPKYLRESLDVSNISSLQDLKDFIELCEERGLGDLVVEYETREYSLDYFNIICSRNTTELKTEEELQAEYFNYANRIINNNIVLWEKHADTVEKEKREFAHYLALKEKFEGKNDK